MRRAVRFCALALLALSALPAAAQQLSLAQVSGYLNSFQSAQGRFTQINDDGSTSSGRIFIKRPGRVRFEYNPPDSLLVVADGDRVGVIDPKSNTGPEAYPLHRTPLKIVLARRVDLGRERMVTGHASDGTTTTIRAQDPEHPEYGNIELVFTANPIALTQWVINDGSGTRTTIVLGDLQKDVRLDNDRFVIPGKEGHRPVDR